MDTTLIVERTSMICIQLVVLQEQEMYGRQERPAGAYLMVMCFRERWCPAHARRHHQILLRWGPLELQNFYQNGNH